MAEREVVVKTQHDTPETDQRPSKRQKTNRPSLDPGRQLALEHLLHDDPSHPLYHRNADHIVNTFVDRDNLTRLVQDPIQRCLKQQQFGDPNLDPNKILHAKRALVDSVAKTVLAALGSQYAALYDMNRHGRKVEVAEDAEGYRVELGVLPVYQCNTDDDFGTGPSNGGVSTREAIGVKAERRAAKAAKRAQKERAHTAQAVPGPSTTTRKKRGAPRGCAVQTTTEERSARGGYADDDPEEDGDDGLEEDEDDESDQSPGEDDGEDEYEE